MRDSFLSKITCPSQFIMGQYNNVITSGRCIIVRRAAFSEEESKFPPTYIRDQISGNYRIYFQGEMKKHRKQKWICSI